MGSITVIGTGFRKEQLTLEAASLLKSGKRVILHTGRCGAAEYLDESGIVYETLDELYETHDDFDEHAEAAAETVTAAAENSDVLYCVMDVRDRSAGLLAESGAEVIAGPSCEGALMAFSKGGAQLYAAADWEEMRPDACADTIIREIDNRELAAEVKLRLMEAYPDDAEVMVESAEFGVKRIELFDLDRLQGYDHRFCALIKGTQDISQLNDITMHRLVEAARMSDKFYAEVDAAELANAAARIAGGIAYAEDRGEFCAADIMIDARDILMD